MAKRNVNKIVKSVRINEYYDLTIDELNQLREMLGTSIGEQRTLEAFLAAFKYGYAMGQRAERKAIKGA